MVDVSVIIRGDQGEAGVKGREQDSCLLVKHIIPLPNHRRLQELGL